MTSTRCNRPGCPGTISATGYCGRCFRKPLPQHAQPASGPAPAAEPASTCPAPARPSSEGSALGESPKATLPVPGESRGPAPGEPPLAAAPEPTPPKPPPPARATPEASAPARSAPAPEGPAPQARAPVGPASQEPSPSGALPLEPSTSGPPPSAHPTFRTAGELDLDGLVVLPHIEAPHPTRVVKTTARPPSGGRRCGVRNCIGIVGVGYGGRPAPDTGYCPQCAEPYSFKPGLHPGDLVGEHYRVLGYLATGGLGWVYLAQDTRLPDHFVVLKGLIHKGDDSAQQIAMDERSRLTTLHHRDIVRIITYERHQAAGERKPTGYIVMEYIGGRSLQQLLFAPVGEREELFGGPFAIDHVLTYGCKILGALEYLHGQGLLYCDMKPDNVIHYGQEIKIIDLGAVRGIGDHTSAPVYHPHYAPGKRERDSRGFHIDTDLYTVGKTLQVLAASATPATGLAARSFERLIQRATHPEPAARFTSAGEMSRQVWQVLREHRALQRHESYPERPTHFEPTAELFGAALGAIPPLRHWTVRSGTGPPDLDIGLPDALQVARGLHVPVPDPADACAVLLPGLAADSPERVALQVTENRALRTAEVALWLCRAFLGAREAGRPGRHDIEQAARWLRQAAVWLGADTAAYDWRLSWHRGVLSLARGQVTRAADEFAATFAALPGESAPKLALGYCCEHLYTGARADATGRAGATGAERRDAERDTELRDAEQGTERDTEQDTEQDTERYYEAVWQRDRTQASAAFGLARVRLRRGERAAAVDVLDKVPSTSRHYYTAQIAVVRVLAGRVLGRDPTAGQLGEAADRRSRLRLDGHEPHDRLVAEIVETAARCRPAGGWGPRLPLNMLFGVADTPRDLYRLLHDWLWKLAGQTTDPKEQADLLDLAYDVRPETRF